MHIIEWWKNKDIDIGLVTKNRYFENYGKQMAGRGDSRLFRERMDHMRRYEVGEEKKRENVFHETVKH